MRLPARWDFNIIIRSSIKIIYHERRLYIFNLNFKANTFFATYVWRRQALLVNFFSNKYYILPCFTCSIRVPVARNQPPLFIAKYNKNNLLKARVLANFVPNKNIILLLHSGVVKRGDKIRKKD